eukprot:CAMPEP_0182532884 /NCGR_PEP_ID=MMETSP1323-20130603/12547_1 /TAXON_ID=236787 /ORGANISM="Florenciella parvula, Strain RCC1693" /LENGTH=116 /DNA_ID=CAMNT_0024742693 /DNA_START=27 /DNA_END=373 /DNA_ORIENTATION=+
MRLRAAHPGWLTSGPPRPSEHRCICPRRPPPRWCTTPLGASGAAHAHRLKSPLRPPGQVAGHATHLLDHFNQEFPSRSQLPSAAGRRIYLFSRRVRILSSLASIAVSRASTSPPPP